jgi:predicted ferric reductase
MKEKMGKIIVYLLALIPLFLWLFSLPLNERFLDSDTTLSSIGQVAGLVGLALFAVSLILSGRLKFLERFFGGLNNMYKVHHELGGYALILLVVHPLSLAISYGFTSLLKIILFVLPDSSWQKSLGSVSFILLFILLFITFYTKLPYQIWKWTHKFLGLSFFLGGLHALFIGSDIARNHFLKYYLIILCSVAVIVYFYRTVLFKFTVKRHRFTIQNISNINGIFQISLRPEKEKLRFEAGQFVFISFEQRGFPSESHPFSIVSAQNEDVLQLGIKALGDFTKKLSDLKIGTVALIEGPFGVFSYKKAENKRRVWIAGGIGITPFISMAKTIQDGEYDVDLYYCVNNHEEAVFMNELRSISERNRSIQVIPWISKEKGFLNTESINQLSGNLVDKDYFLCGPPAMMKNIRKQLNSLNIPDTQIHSEEFAY